MSLVEFNNWYEDKGEKLHIYRDEKWIAKYGFEAGQQSQQAKIDNLQKENDRLNTSYKNVKLQFENKQIDCDRSDRKIDELQARIDKALYHLDFNHDNDKDIAISILKQFKEDLK